MCKIFRKDGSVFISREEAININDKSEELIEVAVKMVEFKKSMLIKNLIKTSSVNYSLFRKLGNKIARTHLTRNGSNSIS